MTPEPWAGRVPASSQEHPCDFWPELAQKLLANKRKAPGVLSSKSSPVKVETDKFPKAGEGLLVVPDVIVASVQKYLSWKPLDSAVSGVSHIMERGPLGDKASHGTHQEVNSCLETQAALRFHSGLGESCSKVKWSLHLHVMKSSLTPACESTFLPRIGTMGCFCTATAKPLTLIDSEGKR